MISGLRSAIFLRCLLAVATVAVCSCSGAQTTPQDRNVTDTKKVVSPPGTAGKYFALVIGIATYQYEPPLATPLNDAREIAAVLKDQYGFETQVLLDATRDQILAALEGYRRNLSEPDSLLVYYAGHGYFDKQMKIAYLAPVDATQESYAHWIIAPEITGTVRAIPARHVLVIADSCYSGMLTLKAAVPPDSGSASDPANAIYLEKMTQARSRNVLASGGDEPVADGDAPGHFSTHSVFANVLLENLSLMQANEFTAEQLYIHVFGDVQRRGAAQKPEYDPIPENDLPHQNGDFVFRRVKTVQGSIEATHAVMEPVASRNPDEDGVRAALDQYQDAYESMDLRELKKVWPTLSKNQEKELKSGFQAPGLNAVKVQLRNRTLRVAGDSATADCDQWMIYTFSGRRQPPQTSSVEILLAKESGGTWAIQTVKGK
jgi:caspase domain-containing protein